MDLTINRHLIKLCRHFKYRFCLLLNQRKRSSIKIKTLSNGNSNNDELNHLETEINNIISSKKDHDEKSNLAVFKDIYLVGLMEQIKFLKEDSIKKSNIIMSLI